MKLWNRGKIYCLICMNEVGLTVYKTKNRDIGCYRSGMISYVRLGFCAGAGSAGSAGGAGKQKRAAWDLKGRLHDMEALMAKQMKANEDLQGKLLDNSSRVAVLEQVHTSDSRAEPIEIRAHVEPPRRTHKNSTYIDGSVREIPVKRSYGRLASC